MFSDLPWYGKALALVAFFAIMTGIVWIANAVFRGIPEPWGAVAGGGLFLVVVGAAIGSSLRQRA